MGITVKDLLNMTPEQMLAASSKQTFHGIDSNGLAHVSLHFADDDIPEDVQKDLDEILEEDT